MASKLHKYYGKHQNKNDNDRKFIIAVFHYDTTKCVYNPSLLLQIALKNDKMI